MEGERTMMDELKNLLMEYNCPDTGTVREMEITDCNLSFLQIRDRLYLLGNILHEDADKNIYVASIRSGFANMNQAIVAMQLKEKKLHLAGYAKEGIIKQNILEHAFKRIADAAHGKQVKDSSRRIHSLLFLLPIVAIALCILLSRSISAPTNIEKEIRELPSTQSEEPSAVQESETAETEDTKHIMEVQLIMDATKDYNSAVNTFNTLVEEYNQAVSLMCIDNIDGLPEELDKLSLESESYEANEQALNDGITVEMISADTETILDMADQVARAVTLVKQITAPSEKWVAERLEDVSGITGIQAVTENHDPDDLLGEEGGYSACIYFTVMEIDPKSVPGNSIVEKGTDAGGAVEIYATLGEAEDRCEYLAGFDGTILYSGSYALVGTMVIRTSYKLENIQQYELTNAITKALTSLER